MHDPRTIWLTITNIALGLAVVALIVSLITGVLCDFVARVKKRHAAWKEIDKDLPRLFHG